MSIQVQEPAAQGVVATGPRSNAPIGKILVVDDEPKLRSVLVESLLKQGYEVAGCSSGYKALAELRQHDFDVLLTDLMMPEMDGIALLKAALEIDPHLVGIMVTGQGSIQTAVDAMQTGAFDYVLKPFRMQTLLPVLTRAMNVRHLKLENVQLRETVAIHSLCQTIAFTLDAQTVLSKLADAALQQSDADEVSILLPTNDGTELYVAAVRGEKRERLLGERVSLQESISSWVARERQPLILNGTVRDERFVAHWPRADIRSAVSVPMEVANRLVGIINLNVTNRSRPFTLGQMKALSILASTAAAALESASLYAQVQQAEKNYRSIFENAVEGIFQSTADRQFLTVNPALAHILGYDSPEEVIASFTDIGKQLHVDPASQAQLAQILDERGILQGFEFEAYRKNGEKIWLSLNLRVIRDDRAMEASREGTIEDITERKRAEMERLVMFEIIQGISTSADLGALLKLVHQTIEKVVYAENCFVALYEQLTDTLDMQFFVDKYDTSPPPQKLGKSCAAYVFRTGAACLINKKLFAELVEAGEVELVGEPSPSWLGVPLNTPARTIGVLVVQHYEDDQAYNERDVEFLSSVAGQIAVAIERKRAEESLRESEERYHLLFASNPLPMWVYDLETLAFLEINDAAIYHYGYSREELLAMTILDIRPPEDAVALRENLFKVSNGLDEAGVWQHRKKNGQLIDVEITSHELIFAGRRAEIVLANDVTERRRTEEIRKRRTARVGLRADVTAALAESNIPLRRILERCTEGMVQHLGAAFARIWTLNREENVLELQASAGLYTHIDGPHARVPVGMFKIGLIAEERLPHITNDVQTDPRVSDKEWASREGMIAFAGYPLVVEDKLVGVMAMFSHQRLPEDTLDALASVAEVIAQGIERKRMEKALRESEEQLRQSQKMEAIGQLAGGVAHDFNNLLTAINGYSALALRRVGPDHPISSYLEEIKKGGDRAANLTRQLLAFGRKQLLQPLAINLNDIVGDMIKLLKRLIGEDVQLVTKPCADLKQIKADPGQLEQVLVNLVVNARDAMPRGGTVTIETANTTLDGAYASKHLGVTPGQYVMLAISDTGTGMDQDTRTRVFEPFFTTKEKGKGTGLGLSTVYGIVRQSGGNVWVYSELGKGTTFKVYLPQIDEEVAASAGLKEDINGHHGSETVLLVEDEDMVRRLTSELLEESGYLVLEANGGEQAIAVFTAHKERIDLLITDVVMPKMSGKEVAEQLRNVHPETKVLFMSGYTDEAIVHHGIVDSHIAFIQKPFSENALTRKVRDVLDAETGTK